MRIHQLPNKLNLTLILPQNPTLHPKQLLLALLKLQNIILDLRLSLYFLSPLRKLNRRNTLLQRLLIECASNNQSCYGVTH